MYLLLALKVMLRDDFRRMSQVLDALWPQATASLSRCVIARDTTRKGRHVLARTRGATEQVLGPYGGHLQHPSDVAGLVLHVCHSDCHPCS